MKCEILRMLYMDVIKSAVIMEKFFNFVTVKLRNIYDKIIFAEIILTLLFLISEYYNIHTEDNINLFFIATILHIFSTTIGSVKIVCRTQDFGERFSAYFFIGLIGVLSAAALSLYLADAITNKIGILAIKIVVGIIYLVAFSDNLIQLLSEYQQYKESNKFKEETAE